MAKPLPMPVELVTGHPAVIALPNAAWHLVMAVSVTYWQSECRNLPRATTDWIVLARSDGPTWYKHRDLVTCTILQVAKLLADRMVEEREKLAARIAKSADAGRKAALAKRAARDAAAAISTSPEPPSEPLTPVARAPGHVNQRIDMSARRAAVGRSRGMSGGTAPLTDGGAGLLEDSPLAPNQASPADGFGAWTWEPGPAPAQETAD